MSACSELKTTPAQNTEEPISVITGKPGGTRSLRVTPGWLDTAAPGDLPPADVITPPAPLHVPGVTVGQIAARWATRDDSAGPADAPALAGADADLLADILAGL